MKIFVSALLSTIALSDAFHHLSFPVTERSSFLSMHDLFPRRSIWTARSPYGGLYTSTDRFLKEFMNTLEAWESFGGVNTQRMPLDVKETEKTYEIYVDIPGVNKDSVNIEIKDHILTITSERKALETSDTETLRRNERVAGAASRSLRLPEDADEDKVAATFENGILQIFIPRLPEQIAKGVKKVEINYKDKENQT